MHPKLAGRVSVADLFDQLMDASTMMEVLSLHHRILNLADLSPCEFNVFYPRLKEAIFGDREMLKNWKSQALFTKIDKKSGHKCYSNTRNMIQSNSNSKKPQNRRKNTKTAVDSQNQQQKKQQYANNNALKQYNCLVIGAGPAGLRTAIELQFLGATKVAVVEKRNRFSRNNVLHLWPFVIEDLKSLGAKELYGKFCAGSIDHISIRQLQLMLLKISLIVGCDFRESCSFASICPASLECSAQDKLSKEKTCDLSNSDKNVTNNHTKVCDNLSVLENDSDSDIENGLTGKNVVTLSVKHTRIVVSPVLLTREEQDCDAVSDGTNKVFETKELNNQKDVETCEDDSSPRRPTPKPTVTFINPNNKSIAQEPANLRGVRVHIRSNFPSLEEELHSYKWDVIVGADGRRNTLSGYFPRNEFRGRLAIAITANFVNKQTPKEAAISEISGISYIYKQDLFNALAQDTDIMLENICYYKDDTHYFVMTAKKNSLLCRNVLKEDFPLTHDLLSESNVDQQALLQYAKDAATWSTGLEPLEFALNHYEREDCAMFDFTSMYAASNASKAIRSKEGGLTLLALVGDTLLEPFWPTGSGCGRGFLSSFDAAWMCRQWAISRCALVDRFNMHRSKKNSDKNNRKNIYLTHDAMALNIIAERESIYRILAQTTSENVQQNYSQYSLIPHSRYPHLNKHLVSPSQVEHLIMNEQDLSNNACSNQHISTSIGPAKRNQKIADFKNPKLFKNQKGFFYESLDLKRCKMPLSSSLSNVNSTESYGSHYSLGNNRCTSMESFRRSSESSEPLSSSSDDVDFDWRYEDLYTDLGYGRHKENLEDLFVDSTGTNPSINNLFNLEANRDREIEECLRLQRQKARLHVLSSGQSRRGRNEESFEHESPVRSVQASELYRELKRVRERKLCAGRSTQRFADKIPPLTVYNSIRRCTSFAERVKSFENKLTSKNGFSETTTNAPKFIESVRHTPQFEMLQKLLCNANCDMKNESLTMMRHSSVETSRIPVLKLTKADWNVRCWEDRLSAYKSNNHSTSDDSSGLVTKRRTINRANSVDLDMVLEKKIEVFQERIKEMSEKLMIAKSTNQKLYSLDECSSSDGNNFPLEAPTSQSQKPSNLWINHLKQELSSNCRRNDTANYISSLSNRRKPVGKLFPDEDEDD